MRGANSEAMVPMAGRLCVFQQRAFVVALPCKRSIMHSVIEATMQITRVQSCPKENMLQQLLKTEAGIRFSEIGPLKNTL